MNILQIYFLTTIATANEKLIDKSAIQFQPDFNELLGSFLPTGERYVLAAQLSGNVKSAFPGGPPASGTGSSWTPTWTWSVWPATWR